MSYLGEEIPKLGFGLMRLPRLGREIDLDQMTQMVDLFLESGFTYFDTAYGYEGSEAAARKTLVERYPRESYVFATKLPAWAGPRNAQEAQAMFWTSLERTGVGYFDYYLLHNVGGDHTRYFDEYGIWQFLMDRKSEGLIKHLGMSFHDKANVLESVLAAHPEIEFVQLQINYLDWESDSVQSRRCWETALWHGRPVIVMEPIKGGALANPPESVRQILLAADPEASPASWALRFAASLDGIITVLSGMSTLDQMRENTHTLKHFRPLTEAEKAVLAAACEAYNAIPVVPCTECKYCVEGCPNQVRIPWILGALNTYLRFGSLELARHNYAFATREGGKASECIRCGQCESACPQHIAIMDELERARDLLEQTG